MPAAPGGFVHDRANGVLFDDEDVARSYLHRAPYSPALFDFMLSQTGGRERALDLGCGPGKIAGIIASRFRTVDAVDPSRAMIEVGRARHQAPNINWVCATAENFEPTGAYDLVTAGMSIHWTDHAVLFPKLARLQRPGAIMAIIHGDHARDPEWREPMADFLRRWLPPASQPYDPAVVAAAGGEYRDWLDVTVERTFDMHCVQSLCDFIDCQHSRASWTRRRMGRDLAEAFDEDLRLTMTPFTVDGMLSFCVQTDLVCGHPRERKSKGDEQ